jgi:DNA-binding NtrC family response regulator
MRSGSIRATLPRNLLRVMMVPNVVLLVTPDHAQLSMTATALRMSGLSVIRAEGSRAAIARLRSSSPCAVVVEYPFQMEHGLELLSELQAERVARGLRVIAIPAHGLPIADVVFAEQQVDLLFLMPVSAAAIAERTAAFVKGSGPPQK